MRRMTHCILLLLLFLTPSSCRAEADSSASTTASGTSSRKATILIEGVPHVRQKPDFCGEACAEMYLRKLGREVTQDDVFNASGLDPLLGRGCYTAELQRALTRLGFKVGTGGSKIDADKADVQLEEKWKALEGDLKRGVPSIVCMHTSDAPGATEHFRLLLGYDGEADEIIYHEPAAANGAYWRMTRKEFLKLWPLKYQATRWTLIALPLEPGNLASAKHSTGFTDADYAQHIMELKKKVPKEGFTILLERPFVVIGDEPAARVKERALRTVRWAVERLKKQYFTKDPNEILNIWLFKDKESYEKHTREIFGDTPTTPFGYFSRQHKALIMNIATGGGTLVHEIVHPFVESNFPECPAWFNEGLGSLYEQSSYRGGRIVGLTNWRLAGLQKAIKADRVPSFKDLTSTTNRQFYGQDPGTNYAQARYLCYYLQEKGLLEKFHRQFHAAAKDDPTGYETLKKILATDDMDAFQKKWEKFVLALTFP